MLEAYIVHCLGERITALVFALILLFFSALIALPFIVYEYKKRNIK